MKVCVRYFLVIILLSPGLQFGECTGFHTDSFQNLFNWAKETFFSATHDLPSFARNLMNIFSAAIDEDCIFKCPNGRKPKPKPYHVPVGNGCGVPGLQIPKYVPMSKLEDCCTEHDVCYGTCNEEKDDCDKKFKHCLYKICSRLEKLVSADLLKGCKAVAKTLYTAVTAMGCKYYLDAQKDACICNINYYSNEL